ncbi:MAG: HD domain-containing protein [Candidatus Saccharibacteria bacterium]|nr:HD domain-containing protein [Candidatus Saccharibacteria bacterium]
MKRDVEFLFEVGAMRFIPRQWHRFHMFNVQSLTEHHYRVIWLALLIAAREKKGDIEKIMKMALVHDVAESRTGDVDYLARQYVTRNEDMAIQDILEDTSLEQEFIDIIQEYEKRESIESKIVKDADNIDVDLDLAEQALIGHEIRSEWQEMRDHVGKTKLYTKSAKLLQAEIRSANPHDWHTKSPRNRRASGDWKK